MFTLLTYLATKLHYVWHKSWPFLKKNISVLQFSFISIYRTLRVGCVYTSHILGYYTTLWQKRKIGGLKICEGFEHLHLYVFIFWFFSEAFGVKTGPKKLSRLKNTFLSRNNKHALAPSSYKIRG